MNKKYAKAYTEVLEILKHVPKEEYERIPKTEIQFYENNCDKNYKFFYNEELSLKEQVISGETKEVIIALYMSYLANDKQRTIIEGILKQNSKEIEKENDKNYDVNNIFKDPQNYKSDLPIKVEDKKDNIIYKIINKIKKLFIKQ